MKRTAALATMTALAAPRRLEPWQLEVGLEGGSVPSLSEEERRVGFGGVKVEDLNRASAFGRVRLTLGLPGRVTATLGYVPPVEIDGVEPNLWALSLGRRLVDTEGWRLGLRLLAQTGTIEGDITCDRATVAAGADPAVNPFGCEERSTDEISLDSWGGELSSAFRAGASGRWWPYLSASASRLDAEFQVRARYSGLIDRNRLLADGWIYALAAGLDYRPSERLALAAEVYYAPLDVARPPATEADNEELVNLRVTYGVR
jgi:hypothetical protein